MAPDTGAGGGDDRGFNGEGPGLGPDHPGVGRATVSPDEATEPGARDRTLNGTGLCPDGRGPRPFRGQPRGGGVLGALPPQGSIWGEGSPAGDYQAGGSDASPIDGAGSPLHPGALWSRLRAQTL